MNDTTSDLKLKGGDRQVENKIIAPRACCLCGGIEDKPRQIERHHTSYFPEETIDVCKRCHHKIHYGKYKNLAPPKAQSIIYFNVSYRRLAARLYLPFAAGALTIDDVKNAARLEWLRRRDHGRFKIEGQSSEYKRAVGYVNPINGDALKEK